MPNISVDEFELLGCSEGIAENSRQLNITEDEILKDISEEVVADINNIFDIDVIIHGLTFTIDWAKNDKLDLNEIITLRRIREKAINEKIQSNLLRSNLDFQCEISCSVKYIFIN